ncbi:MAG TPA: hypothetical protein VF269_09985 [Rhodanobacteraceae bacterium]
MTTSRICLVALLASGGLLLAGCSGHSTPPATTSAQAKTPAHASTRLKTPWDGLLKDEAKAKGVQQVINQSAKRQQQAIEKATGGN